MFFAANWKMNLDKNSIKKFCDNLKNIVFNDNIKVTIFPPTIYINYLSDLLIKSPVSVGGQNCHFMSSGAFTGDISSNSLKEFGCEFVIVGHSERRSYYKETNSYIKSCAEAAIKNDITPIICVGESLNDRENNNALNFIERQINECLPDYFEKIIIAYEPIWSIGTGKIPSSNQIKEIHSFIKKTISLKSKKNVKVLYGGSVNSLNINEILLVKNVDGVLVGGASLKIKEFLAIYNSAVKQLTLSSQ